MRKKEKKVADSGIEKAPHWGEVLIRLRGLALEDHGSNEEAVLLDILDYLSQIGVPGASDLYAVMISRPRGVASNA